MYHSVLNENVAASFHTAEAIHKIMKQMCHEQFCFHSHLSVMMYMGSIWAPAVIVKQCRTGLRKLIPFELLNKFPLQVSEIQKKTRYSYVSKIGMCRYINVIFDF